MGLNRAAEFSATHGIVAGNAHLAAELARRGIEHVAGKDVQSYDDAIAATIAAEADLAVIRPQLSTLTEPLQAITLAILARESLRHHALRYAQRRLQGRMWQTGPSGLEPVSGRVSSIRMRHSPAQAVMPRMMRGTSYMLDFCSATGQKGQVMQQAVLQPRLSKRPVWQDFTLNLLAMTAVRMRRQTPQALRLHLAAPDGSHATPEIVLQSGFADCARQIITETAVVFAAAEATMDRVLSVLGVPEIALFNHVGDAAIAGFQSSLRRAGVACEMSSHGALAAWGNGPRHRLAGYLGAIYNDFPGMTALRPRARHLVQTGSQSRIVRQVRLKALQPEGRRDGAFRIYAAPNFRPWSEGFWGITNTCFDTVTILETLSRAVHGLDDISLFLRIKLTAKDLAKPKKRPVNRGLFPDDIAHLIDPERGIHDASFGAHSRYLADADLVVTEGLTAVMFEALEMRCPVLLIVPDHRAASALPAAPVQRLREPGFRSAVYTANPADNLPEALHLLALAHRGQPLSDAELAPYLWMPEAP